MTVTSFGWSEDTGDENTRLVKFGSISVVMVVSIYTKNSVRGVYF